MSKLKRTISPTPTGLSTREMEIFELLLGGKSPKEIGYELTKSFPTVKYHQKNIYKKLGVRSIQKLFAKYKFVYTLPPKSAFPKKLIITATIVIIAATFTILLLSTQNKEFIPILDPWYAVNDPRSICQVLREDEIIEGKLQSCVTLSGFLFNDELLPLFEGLYAGACYPVAGAFGIPFGESLDAIRTMRSLSFKVLGDGNFYCIRFPTFETIDGDHWVYVFQAVKDEIMSVNINIPDDIVRAGWSGKDAKFVQKNIMFLQIQTVDPGDFKVKFWEFRFNQ